MADHNPVPNTTSQAETEPGSKKDVPKHQDDYQEKHGQEMAAGEEEEGRTGEVTPRAGQINEAKSGAKPVFSWIRGQGPSQPPQPNADATDVWSPEAMSPPAVQPEQSPAAKQPQAMEPEPESMDEGKEAAAQGGGEVETMGEEENEEQEEEQGGGAPEAVAMDVEEP